MRVFPDDVEQRPVFRLEKGVLMRQAAVIALCAILLSGCCIPVPRSENVARVPGILRQRPKLDGVVEGVTTRHELEQILSGFSTNASDREFFWARWEDPSDPFACGVGAIDANRDWKNVNVLAISDASGVLKRYRVCSDRDLGDCLTSMADNVVSPPGADSTAIKFSVHCDRGPYKGAKEFIGKAAFDAAGIALLQTHRGSAFRTLDPPLRFVIPLKQIQEIAIRRDADPEHVNMVLRFKPGTQPVDNLTSYGASPRDTWRLIWLVRSLNPSFAPVRAASGCPAAPRESCFAPAR
jgi:hypothetical protein